VARACTILGSSPPTEGSLSLKTVQDKQISNRIRKRRHYVWRGNALGSPNHKNVKWPGPAPLPLSNRQGYTIEGRRIGYGKKDRIGEGVYFYVF